jgi:2-phosphoglycerate kinase
MRLEAPGRTPPPKYMRALSDIRRIQDYLVTRAEEAGVPVIESSRLEKGVEKRLATSSPRSGARRSRN